MNGMNPDPCASYSLVDRFTCSKCGTSPNLKKVDGSDPLIITFECHGETITQQFTKSALVFQQFIFATEE